MRVALAGQKHDTLTGKTYTGSLDLAPYGVALLR
ncbi:Beta-galactosidase C-terminal domain [Sphingomonas aurantiaca]